MVAHWFLFVASLVDWVSRSLPCKALRNLKSMNPGFDVKNLLAVFRWSPLSTVMSKPWTAHEYYRRLRERLQTMPGVESAAFVGGPFNSGQRIGITG